MQAIPSAAASINRGDAGSRCDAGGAAKQRAFPGTPREADRGDKHDRGDRPQALPSRPEREEADDENRDEPWVRHRDEGERDTRVDERPREPDARARYHVEREVAHRARRCRGGKRRITRSARDTADNRRADARDWRPPAIGPVPSLMRRGDRCPSPQARGAGRRRAPGHSGSPPLQGRPWCPLSKSAVTARPAMACDNGSILTRPNSLPRWTRRTRRSKSSRRIVPRCPPLS